jgi:putative salt-induced outer membrane protein YdiY
MKTIPFANHTALLTLCFGVLSAFGQDQAPVGQQASKWQTTASAGVTLTRGNSETLLATLSAATQRKWEHDQLALGAMATYGKTKDQATDVTTRNADSYRGFIQYDQLFTERFYGYARVEGLYDSIAAINYRFTMSPGAGYYLIKEKTTDLSVEAGPGYIVQKLAGERSNFATLRAAEKFHHSLNDHARIWEMVEWLPKVEAFNNYIINAELGVAADLTQKKNLSLSVVLQDTYNSVPAEGRKTNDLKLIAGLNYKF